MIGDVVAAGLGADAGSRDQPLSICEARLNSRCDVFRTLHNEMLDVERAAKIVLEMLRDAG